MSSPSTTAVRLLAVALVAGTTLTTTGCVPGRSTAAKPSPTVSSPSGPTPEKWAAAVCPAFADALVAPDGFADVDNVNTPEAAKIGWQRAAEKAIETYDTFLDVLDEPTPTLANAPEVVGVLKGTFGALRARMVAIRDDAQALDTTDQEAFTAGAQGIVDSLSGAKADLNKLDEVQRVDRDGTVSDVLQKDNDCAAFGG
jgi:hypothetical protein